jgi:hypothetical protein
MTIYYQYLLKIRIINATVTATAKKINQTREKRWEERQNRDGGNKTGNTGEEMKRDKTANTSLAHRD